ncbi:MAG TPA: lipopolysaccharide biosynthesis protein [Ktedonobacterales bacterium]|jgi:O-antigen/teichoic acid export membrane protein
MPLSKLYQRIGLMRQNTNEVVQGEAQRPLLPEEQEKANPQSSPEEEEAFAQYLSSSLPDLNIDKFPTAPMPLYTLNNWPTQPLPRMPTQKSLLPEPVEADYSSDGRLATLVSPETKSSSIEALTEPRVSSAPAASYVETARTMVKSSGIYALASLASPLVSLVLAPFLTHRLSQDSYGMLAVLTTVLSLTTGITQLGLGSAFFRVYSYEYTEPRDRRSVLATIIVLLPLVSIPVAIVASLLAPALAGVLLDGRSSLGGLITTTAWIVVVQNLTVPGFAWLRAENRPLFYSLLSISNVLIVLGANLLLVGLLGWGVEGSLLATGSGYASVALCTVPVILWRSRLRVRKDIAWSLLTFGTPLVFSAVSYWVLQVSDRYLLSLFGSLAQTASYTVAYSLGSVLATLVIAPFSLAWPATMYAVAKRKDAPQVFRMIFRWFSTVLLFVAFAVSIGGTLLLDWLFLKNYHSAAPIIPVVAESLVFYGLYSVFMTGVSVQRKTWMHAAFTAGAAFVNFALNLLLIPRYGAAGAAASTLIAYIVLALVGYLANQRIYPVPYEMKRFLLALLMGVALYIGADVFSLEWGVFWRWPLTFVCLILYGVFLLFLAGGIGLLRAHGARLITRIASDWRVS